MKANNLISFLIMVFLLISSVLIFQFVYINKESKTVSNTIKSEPLIYNSKITSNLVAFNVSTMDVFTKEPLAGAEVVVYNDTDSISGLTNINGKYTFNIEPGWYKINISMVYYYNSTFSDLWIDNWISDQEYGLVPLNGVGIISTNQILEFQTYNVELTWTATGAVYDYSVYIDSNFIVSSASITIPLGPLIKGVHNLTVVMSCSEGLFSDQIDLYVLGINFLNPVNESIVQGGLILVQFEYIGYDPSNPIYFNSLTAAVNGTQYINTNVGDITCFMLPVFQNATYIFDLTFDYYLGTLKYNLTVTATNVVPALEVSIGDYWIYSVKELNAQTMLGTQSTFEVSVTDKISPTEVNMTILFSRYDIATNSLEEFTTGWRLVNTLNGYIESGGGNLTLPIDAIFFIFTGLQNSYMTASIYNNFYMVSGKVSESSWNGVDTWKSLPLASFPSGITWVQHNMKTTGILLYLTYYAYDLQIFEIKLLDSTYLPVAPQLLSNELTFEQGTTTQLLSWRVQGSGSYKIFQNDILVKTGTWSLDELITYDLSSLVTGDYNITALFYNSLGVFSLYETNVHVLPQAPPEIIRYPNINSSASMVTNMIIWSVYDDSSGNYIVYKNGILDESGSWNSGDQITYTLGTLVPGYYNFTIKITDGTGLSTIDQIIILIPNQPEPITTTEYQTITTIVSDTTTDTDTVTTTQTTISTTKTSEGFSVILMVLGVFTAFIIRRKRNS